MLQTSLIFLILHILPVSGNRFTFDSTSLVSTTENWLHEEIPCIGDRIRFDNTLPVVAFMDHNVNVESIQLPDNGLIIFTDNGIDLGGDANWQCAKNNLDESKDVFFTRDSRHDTSFYNPKNWIPEHKKFLHMNQVPSEEDDAIVSHISAVQMYLDIPVKVNGFKWYNREKMTTEDFNVLLRSMEGQFQINLARPWAHESDQGGVQRLLAQDAITVINKKLESNREGTVNSNSKNKTLSTICSYIQCDEITQCINSFTPFGHCCPVCGTRIELVAFELSYDLASAAVFNVLNALETDATVFATFERKTTTWGNSLYEVALINAKNSTFDEDFHVLAAREIIEKLAITMKINHHNAILNFSVFSSKIDRSVKLMSKVVACVIYFAVLMVLAGMFVYQNVEMRVARNTIFNPVIKYRRRTDDDVAIEMDGVGGPQNPENLSQEPENSDQDPPKIITTQPTPLPKIEDDEVEDWRNINPNFELASSEEVPNQMVFELMETKKPKLEFEEEKDAESQNSDENSGVINKNFLDDFFENPVITQDSQNVEFPDHSESYDDSENLAENLAENPTKDQNTLPKVEAFLDLEAEGAVDSEEEDPEEKDPRDQEDYANPLFINPNFFENSSENSSESSGETQTPEPTLDTAGSQEQDQEDENKENEPNEDGDENEDGMDLVQF